MLFKRRKSENQSSETEGRSGNPNTWLDDAYDDDCQYEKQWV